MKYNWLGVTSVFLILFILLASAATAADYPMTIRDTEGRTVTIQMPVQRIIATNGDAAEAVILLGAGDKIVGVSSTVASKGYYFPSLKGKQPVGTFNSLDYEMIGAIAKGSEDNIVPDIILIGYTYPGKSYGIDAIAKSLAPFGNITCIGLDFYQPENMTAEMEKLGGILGRESEAKSYIDWYNEKASNIKDAVAGTAMPKVYVEWSTKGADLSAMGPSSGAGGMLKDANCFNIVSKIKDPYPVINWEYVVSQKPDIIIKRQSTSSDAKAIGWEKSPSQDAVGLEKAVNEITSRAAASSAPAVKNNKVYVFDWDFMAGPDQIVGLTYLAKVLHPDVDLDPESVYKEYLQFIGLPYPEGRIFVYPEPRSKSK